MATLIAVYNSDGCQGRCDARCYMAKHPDCDCICGGKNHGAGLQQARDNTRAMARQWMEEWNKRHPGCTFDFEVGQEAAQQALF